MNENPPPLTPVISSVRLDRCRKCATPQVFQSAVLAQVGPDGPAVVGGWAACTACGYTPYPVIGGHQKPDGPHPVLGGLAALLFLAAPALWGAAIWSGDGRLGWLSLPVLFAAIVVLVASFAVEPKDGGR